ncbi:Jacalin-like lectin domain [Phytophthora cactorum]|nr:Jacalin-like lectin domain [Phytophthora cactorum]
MRVLHLVLAIMVAFVSINNGVARAVGAPGGRGGGSGNGRTYRRPVPVPVVCEDLTLPPGAEAGSRGVGEVWTKSVVHQPPRCGACHAVILTIVNPSGEESTLYHGGRGGVLKTPLALAEGEYITIMEAHTGKHKEHTRVKYIKFTTNLGNFIEGGTWMGYNITDQVGTDTAKDGYQLGGFIGRSGDELDRVCAIWTSIKPVV